MTLHYIDLNIYLKNLEAPPRLRLYHANGNHEPTGDSVSWDKTRQWHPSIKGQVNRYRCTMEPYKMVPEEYFALIVDGLNINPAKSNDWQYDAGDATYLDGIRLWRDHPGDPWTKEFGDDHLFYIFGEPPSPPPPPPPPIPNWMITDIQQILTATGYKIVVTTNVPCHLYMRWTTIEPQEHMIPVESRGLFLHSDKYFCFDSYHDNEQEEPGDTTTHTFIKEPWEVCETRWFYFWGTINGETSPSTSPIFKKHRTAPLFGPPIEATFYPDPHPEVTSVDGHVKVEGLNLTWPAIITHPGSSFSDTAESLAVGFTGAGGADLWHLLVRSIFLFDTSIIPATANIISATLSLYGIDKRDALGVSPDINIYSSNPASNTQLQATDFSTLGSTPFSTPISYADFNDTAYNVFTLNPAGLAHITKAGISKFGARNANYDVAATEPAWGGWKLSWLEFCSVFYGGVKRPKLTVTYQLPL